MPSIDLSILNQRQTPAFFADTLANRPAASFVGRIFISTDTLDLYRDTGTTWVLLSPSSTGTITGMGAAGQVTYFSAASSITGSNNLFWDTTNNRLGVNTNAPTSSFDVHGTTNVISQLNQLTSGQNALLSFQDNSVGKWRLGNIYNSAANDFGIVDITNTLQRFTIKNTGQTFIGLEATSSGKLVVNCTAADDGIVVIGTSAPSIRLNNGTAIKQAGFGISTATNNFIQGSADRDFCVFNSSTTASPILFGVYNGTNTQEVARVSSSRNFLIGSSTDNGNKLQISGNVSILNNSSLFLLDSAGGSGFSIKNTSGNVASLNQLNNAELSFQAGFSSNVNNIITFKVGAGTEVARITNAGNIGVGTTTPTDYTVFGFGPVIETRGGVGGVFVTKNSTGTILGTFSCTSFLGAVFVKAESNHPLAFSTNDIEKMRITTGGNVLIGTTTSGASKLRIVGLPTSAAGLSSGDIYSNAGILTIVP